MGILLTDAEGDAPPPGRQAGRNRDVSPEAEHGTDRPLGELATDSIDGPLDDDRDAKVLRCQPPLETHELDGEEREPRVRVHDSLEASPADEEDLAARDTGRDQGLSHRESREHVATGAGSGDGEGHLRFRGLDPPL